MVLIDRSLRWLTDPPLTQYKVNDKFDEIVNFGSTWDFLYVLSWSSLSLRVSRACWSKLSSIWWNLISSKMSCNGCKVLRTKCEENCKLRDCLTFMTDPKQQSLITSYIHKHIGRAKVTELIEASPSATRPDLFVSLLYEACGREVNPITGALGLLLAKKWHLVEAAVGAVLTGKELTKVDRFYPMNETDLFPSAFGKRGREESSYESCPVPSTTTNATAVISKGANVDNFYSKTATRLSPGAFGKRDRLESSDESYPVPSTMSNATAIRSSNEVEEIDNCYVMNKTDLFPNVFKKRDREESPDSDESCPLPFRIFSATPPNVRSTCALHSSKRVRGSDHGNEVNLDLSLGREVM